MTSNDGMTHNARKQHSMPGISRQSSDEGCVAPPTWNVCGSPAVEVLPRGDTCVGVSEQCVFDNPSSLVLRAILLTFSVELACKFAVNEEYLGCIYFP